MSCKNAWGVVHALSSVCWLKKKKKASKLLTLIVSKKFLDHTFQNM